MSKITSEMRPSKVVRAAYPCLREHITTGAVWLFYAPHLATCITGIELGKSRQCTPEYFKSFVGSVVITEE